MIRNLKVFLLILGVFIGAAIGYETRPETAEIKIGKLEIQITGKGMGPHDDHVTSDQWRHIAIFALIGGILGLGLGIALDRRRMKF